MRKKLLIVFIFANILFIWGNSVLGQSQSDQISEFVKNILQKYINLGALNSGFTLTDHIVRKAAHVTEFFILAVLLAAMSGRIDLKHMLIVFLCGLAVASFDETIQIFTGRGAAVKDVMLDMCGFEGGMLVCALVRRISAIKNKNKRIQRII